MSRHTDESWFLHFSPSGNNAVVKTTDGVCITHLHESVAPASARKEERVDDIRSQFKDNVRVMAAA